MGEGASRKTYNLPVSIEGHSAPCDGDEWVMPASALLPTSVAGHRQGNGQTPGAQGRVSNAQVLQGDGAPGVTESFRFCFDVLEFKHTLELGCGRRFVRIVCTRPALRPLSLGGGGFRPPLVLV